MIGGDLSGLSIFELIVYTVLIGIVGFPIFVPLVMPLGVLWAPFAALICALRTRSIGLSAKRYAAFDALYSTLLLLPWIYLMIRMYGKVPSKGLVQLGYVLLYIVWSCTIFLNSAVGFPAYTGAGLVQPTGVDRLIAYGVFAILVVNLSTLVFSIVQLSRNHNRSVYTDDSSEDILPHRGYIMPYLYGLIWLVIHIAMLLLWSLYEEHVRGY